MQDFFHQQYVKIIVDFKVKFPTSSVSQNTFLKITFAENRRFGDFELTLKDLGCHKT